MTQPSDSGFQQAAGDLQGIRHGNDQIQQGIANGQLRMNPEAADKAAGAYRKAAREVRMLVRRSDMLSQLTGLGDYISANQLTQKFRQKAGNGSTGAVDLLKDYAEELERKAGLFDQAKQAYQAQEEHISGDLKRVEKGKE